jgi:hypothetical protein
MRNRPSLELLQALRISSEDFGGRHRDEPNLITRGPAYGAQHKAARQRLQDQLNRGAMLRCCERADCAYHVGPCQQLIDRTSNGTSATTTTASDTAAPNACRATARAGARAMLATQHP